MASPTVHPPTITPSDRLLELLGAAWSTQVIAVAAELRIAELLSPDPRSVLDLASATGAHAPSLRRLLRALVTLGVCDEPSPDVFALTPLGAPLAADHPASIRSWALWWRISLWPAWGHLLESVQTGGSARARLLGTAGFDHLAADPTAAAVFHQALVELTRLSAPAIVEQAGLAGCSTLVDVGGGHGELLIAILRAHPNLRGTIFDQPHAEPGAVAHVRAGLNDRLSFVAGDFFQAVPPGADAYILKTIIHDWTDADAVRLLSACRSAMSAHSRLLVIDRVVPDRTGDSPRDRSIARSDLSMLIAHGAGERTRAEFDVLFRTAGLHLVRCVGVGTALNLLEVVLPPSR